MNKKVLGAVSSILIVSLFSVGLYFLNNKLNNNFEYNGMYSESILNKEVPVVNITTKINKPYSLKSVTELVSYYDYNNKDTQEKSILFYDNTYMQSTGIIYGDNKEFDVQSIMDGEIIKVDENEILGKTVEIKHTNNVISTYQCLANIKVKKGDIVKQGDVIATSGNSNITDKSNNLLYFELIIDGKTVNPNSYFNKDINEL